jgi:hypothetical protein
VSIRDAIPRAIAAELAKPKPLKAPQTGGRQPVTSLPPHALGVLAGLADAASTYAALRRRKGAESNALLAGHGPAATAAMIAGTALAKYPMAKLLERVFPRLARAVDANMGATQLGYAAVNLGDDPSATNAYNAALQAELTRSIRQQGR